MNESDRDPEVEFLNSKFVEEDPTSVSNTENPPKQESEKSSKVEIISQPEKKTEDKSMSENPPSSALDPWVKIAFNYCIELLPRNIVVEIWDFLGEELSDFSRMGFESLVNIDTPLLYIENVSSEKDQPSCVFTIGAPGSGKTSWGNHVFGKENTFAADEYFDLNFGGEYVMSELSNAHAWCIGKILEYLHAGKNVVVGNTNTKLSDMFTIMANVWFRKEKFPHKIIFAFFPENNAQILANRTLHGVSAKKIKQMLKNCKKIKNKLSCKSVIRAGPLPNFSRRGKKACMFTALFFEDNQKEELRKLCISHSIDGNLLSNITDCHLTICFQPRDFEMESEFYEQGKKVQVRITGVGLSEEIQCLRAEIIDCWCLNSTPHITIAHATGFKAVLSNYLLEHGEIIALDNGPVFQATMGQKTFQGEVLTEPMPLLPEPCLFPTNPERRSRSRSWGRKRGTGSAPHSRESSPRKKAKLYSQKRRRSPRPHRERKRRRSGNDDVTHSQTNSTSATNETATNDKKEERKLSKSPDYVLNFTNDNNMKKKKKKKKRKKKRKRPLDSEEGQLLSVKAKGSAPQDDLSPPAAKKQKTADDKKKEIEKNLAALEQSLDLSVLDIWGKEESENPKPATSETVKNETENPPPSESKNEVECPVSSEPKIVTSLSVSGNCELKKKEVKKSKKHKWRE